MISVECCIFRPINSHLLKKNSNCYYNQILYKKYIFNNNFLPTQKREKASMNLVLPILLQHSSLRFHNFNSFYNGCDNTFAFALDCRCRCCINGCNTSCYATSSCSPSYWTTSYCTTSWTSLCCGSPSYKSMCVMSPCFRGPLRKKPFTYLTIEFLMQVLF